MNYLFTTHWPFLKRDKDEQGNSPPAHHDIWLDKGKDYISVAKEIKAGDLLFIYELKTGKSLVEIDPETGKKETFKRRNGSMQVVSLCMVNTGRVIKNHYSKGLELYSDGTRIDWTPLIKADSIDSNGSVPLRTVNKVLGYSPNYNLRGYGLKHSGVNIISEEQFAQLLKHYIKSIKAPATFCNGNIPEPVKALMDRHNIVNG